MDYDVAIIGAGVIGASIARKLSQYKLRTVLLEKESDVGFGTSKANSGIIHAGFHTNKRYLKSRLEVRGNLMFDRLKEELDFPFKRTGILVVAFTEEELKIVENLYSQGVENNVIGLEICSRDRIFELEDKLNPDIIGGLHAPNGGIIEPYRFVFSLVESAVINGTELMTDFKVTGASRKEDAYEITSEDKRTVRSRFVINSAGIFADEISRIFGAEEFTLIPRKGEEYLLDKNSSAFTKKVIFPVPTGNSKGILVIPTVEGTTMVGPTAVDTNDKAGTSTGSENLEIVFHNARKLVPGISEKDIITSFAGIRPALDTGDFYIDISKKAPDFIQVAGIQSPGLTAAPAIAEYVKDLLKLADCPLIEKKEYVSGIERIPRMRNVKVEDAGKLVEANGRFGNIVCRCENISEEEIVEAIKRGHTTLDGIKFFTRAEMGRCQGSFCSYKIMKIIMRETGMSYDMITKRGKNSFVLKGKL
jgi:glycerol-3-phosphate dehydrogenase